MYKTIIRKLKHLYNTSSSKRYVEHLRKQGIKIGQEVNFRYPEHTTIDVTRPCLIQIGNQVDINDNFAIMTHDFGTFVFRNLYHDFVASCGHVKLGNNIYIGRNVTILKGVTIGDNCIIGVGSIVTKDIPSNSVACGVPCRVICSIDEYYNKRKLQQVYEAIEFANAIREAKGREPIISDFKEEWNLFFREEDFEKYPEMHNIIDWRIKNKFSEYRAEHEVVFEGFESFLQQTGI